MPDEKLFVVHYVTKSEDSAILLTAIDEQAARLKAKPILAGVHASPTVIGEVIQPEYALVPRKNLKVPAGSRMEAIMGGEPQEPRESFDRPDEL